MRSVFNRVSQETSYVQNTGHPTLLKKVMVRPGLPDEIRFIMRPPEPADLRLAEVQIYRNMVRVSVNGKHPPHLQHTKRGLISLIFDGKRRKRMLDCMNCWRVPNINLVFMHLTYPAEYPLDWRIWKDDLKRFKAALLRKWPDAQGVWKLELQQRGAPHFHMIIDTLEPVAIKRMRQWVDACWARIAHQNDQYQGKYACRVEICWSVRHAMNYCGKYMTKKGSNPIDDDGVILTSADLNGTMGRMWGKIGVLNCDPEYGFTVPVETLDYYRLQCARELKRRGARGWWGLANPITFGSFSVYAFGFASDNRFWRASAMFRKWERDLWTIGDLKQWRMSAAIIVNAMQFKSTYTPAVKVS